MRGPNPKRMGKAGAAWTGIDRGAIENRFGAQFGSEWKEIYLALLVFATMRHDAEALPSETNFRADLDGTISALDSAMDAVNRAIKFDERNHNLARIYDDLEAQYLDYRKQRGDWPEISPGENSRQILSISEAKKQTVHRLIEIAEDAKLDPKRLVGACQIHTANSWDAWSKWFDRTKP